MKKKKRLLWLAFALLTALNLLIFFNRKKFEYRSYRGEEFLYGTCDDNCSNTWERYVKDYPEEDLELADHLLRLQVPRADSTLRKIRTLASFLLSHFDDQRGVPTMDMLSRNPVGQFNLLRLKQEEKLWCGNWSNMFAYFAWNRGITTRIIEILKPGDHHVFNECYVPELESWVMVDLTNQIILPVDDKGSYLHGVSFARSNATLPARSLYFRLEYPWYYYYRYNLSAVYSPESRMKRYLVPEPWYAILDANDSAPGNFLFYLKLIAFFLWLIFLFMILMSLMFNR